MSKHDEKTNQLLEVIQQNPGLRVLPMVEYEVCGGDECHWWAGSLGEASVDEITSQGEYFYIRSKNEEKLINEIIDDEGLDMDDSMSAADIMAYAKKKVDSYDWEKVIVVYIGIPDYD